MPPIQVNLSAETKQYTDAKMKDITTLVYILAGALVINGLLNYSKK